MTILHQTEGQSNLRCCLWQQPNSGAYGKQQWKKQWPGVIYHGSVTSVLLGLWASNYLMLKNSWDLSSMNLLFIYLFTHSYFWLPQKSCGKGVSYLIVLKNIPTHQLIIWSGSLMLFFHASKKKPHHFAHALMSLSYAHPSFFQAKESSYLSPLMWKLFHKSEYSSPLSSSYVLSYDF